MYKFEDLSKAQKQFVVQASYQYASGTITLAEVNGFWQDQFDNRGTTGLRLGYPNWLFKNNKISRGVYQLPLPTHMQLEDYLSAPIVAKGKAKTAKTKITPIVSKYATEDMKEFADLVESDFINDLKANGINI